MLHYVSIKKFELFTQINITPEFENVDKLIKSLKEISKFELKVRTDNVERITSRGITSSLRAAKKAIPSEFIKIGWDLSDKSDSKIKRMIDNLLGKGLRVEGISELSVVSHTKTNSRLEKYDLLQGKVKFVVQPESKSKRVIDSSHMYSLMINKFKSL